MTNQTITLKHYTHTDDLDSQGKLVGTFLVSVQGLLDAAKAAEGIKNNDERYGAELTLFGQTLLVTQLVGMQSAPLFVSPLDPSIPAPMTLPERAAMVLRMAQLGELASFLRSEGAYHHEQAMIRGALYYQGFMGEPMNVAPGFHGDPAVWYAHGKEQSNEFDTQLAA